MPKIKSKAVTLEKFQGTYKPKAKELSAQSIFMGTPGYRLTTDYLTSGDEQSVEHYIMFWTRTWSNVFLFCFSYAQLCQNLLEENVETGEQFCQEFLPSLLFLLTDPVPNVRLSLARTLSQSILMSGMVGEDGN